MRLGPSPLQANTRKKAVLDFSGFAFAEDQKASCCSACQATARVRPGGGLHGSVPQRLGKGRRQTGRAECAVRGAGRAGTDAWPYPSHPVGPTPAASAAPAVRRRRRRRRGGPALASGSWSCCTASWTPWTCPAAQGTRWGRSNLPLLPCRRLAWPALRPPLQLRQRAHPTAAAVWHAALSPALRPPPHGGPPAPPLLHACLPNPACDPPPLLPPSPPRWSGCLSSCRSPGP